MNETLKIKGDVSQLYLSFFVFSNKLMGFELLSRPGPFI